MKAIVYTKNRQQFWAIFDSNLQISKLLRGLVSSIDEGSYFKELAAAKFKNSDSDEALL